MEKDTNIFEYAAKGRLRFELRGALTVEDLYSLSVEELDLIFKKLSKAAKAESEESLLTARPKGTDDLRVKIDIVKHIVADKQREMADRLNAAVVREREQRILRAIADKDDEALRSMTKEELQALLANGK